MTAIQYFNTFQHDSYIGDISSGRPYDIGLIKLNVSLEITAKTAPLALPVGQVEFAGNPDCHMAGWGITGMSTLIIGF